MDEFDKLPDEGSMEKMNKEYALARKRREAARDCAVPEYLKDKAEECMRAFLRINACMRAFAERSSHSGELLRKMSVLAETLTIRAEKMCPGKREEEVAPRNAAACRRILASSTETALLLLEEMAPAVPYARELQSGTLTFAWLCLMV